MKKNSTSISFVLCLITDVAISAPYGGKDQGGVVFIYFGTKDGIETSYRQVRKSFVRKHGLAYVLIVFFLLLYD